LRTGAREREKRKMRGKREKKKEKNEGRKIIFLSASFSDSTSTTPF
jgi:hypothetical protein